MSDDADVERELPATQRKIDKSREEGNIPRSKDFTGALVVLVGVAFFYLFSGFFVNSNRLSMIRALTLSEQDAKDPERMMIAFADLLIQAVLTLTPFLLAVVVAAILVTLAVGGFIFTGKNLEPKFSKMDPIKGLKNMFSSNAMFEFVKALIKVVAIGAVAGMLVWSNFSEYPRMMTIPLPNAIELAVNLAMTDVIVLCVVFAAVVAGDVPYQLYSYYKKLRMNIDEIKREQKETDGDPHLKGRIRQLQRQMSRSRMMAAVPHADVIVTNPTHYAVAINYTAGDGAPRVVAKGVNQVAESIKALGAEHKVPQVEIPYLARALYKHVELDREIPPSLYTAVAKVLAYLYSLDRGVEDESVLPTQDDIPEGMDPGAMPIPADDSSQ